MDDFEVSITPMVVAMAGGLVAFVVLVPWLVRESRRPVAWPTTVARRTHLHPRLRAALLSVRCLAVTVARRMEPTPDAVVSEWRSAHASARSRAITAEARAAEPQEARATEPQEKGAVMSPRAWSTQRERQYEHIKDGLESRGESKDVAEEIAARTVNKERARAGEAKTSSRSSTRDISSGRRGGLRSHRGAGGPTKQQLYDEARRKNVKGRSKMSKAELERAVGR